MQADRVEDGWVGVGEAAPLHHRWYPAPRSTAVLVFLHGLAEHTGRLEHVVADFGTRGFSCATFDLRGHGRSGGRRHHVARFADYLDDLEHVLARMDELAPPSQPRFLVGHSLGGLIAAAAVRERRPRIAGVVLVSPALAFALRPGRLRLCAGRVLDACAPCIPMASHMPLDRVSRNPDVVRLLRAENPRGVRVSPRWYFECRAAQANLFAAAADFEAPLLTLTAGRDVIVDAAAARRFHAAVGARSGDDVHFASCFHALFDEPERDEVLSRIAGWVEGLLAERAVDGVQE